MSFRWNLPLLRVKYDQPGEVEFMEALPWVFWNERSPGTGVCRLANLRLFKGPWTCGMVAEIAASSRIKARAWIYSRFDSNNRVTGRVKSAYSVKKILPGEGVSPRRKR